MNSYEAKDWKQSLEKASSVQKDSSGTVRDQAAFLAGLSEYQMGNYSEAQDRFLISQESADAETAGESNVMLGDIMVRKNRFDEAAKYYDTAAVKLTGEGATRAKELAAAVRNPKKSKALLAMAEPAMSIQGKVLQVSAPAATETKEAEPATKSDGFEKDTNPLPAKNKKSPADKPAKSDDAKPAKPAKSADAKPAKPAKDSAPAATAKNSSTNSDSNAFVIQAGSFVLETSAKNRAKELSKLAAKIGIKAPKVVAEKSKSGQKIWNVYLGEFDSRAEAEKAIKKMGRKDLTAIANPKG